MSSDRLETPLGSSAFIPGLSTYCDRWCERCPLTARCRRFAHTAGVPSGDAPALRHHLGETFRVTLAMLSEITTRTTPARTRPAAYAEEAALRRHPLARASKSYAMLAHAWFEVAEHRAAPAAPAILDAMEVIRWYQFQIHARLMRALHARRTGPPPGARPDPADGAAKVALLGLDRSIAAWHTLWRARPEEEDAVLPLLAILDRLRRDLEAAFPAARAFVRPGFDE